MKKAKRRHLIPRGAIKIALPDTTQIEEYSCGASCLQSISKYYGVGPDDEWDFVDDLKKVGMDKRVGSHPYQIRAVARKYGLRCEGHKKMTTAELLYYLRMKRPVMLMIQAWGVGEDEDEDYRISYDKWWKDGHWVIAIGFDKKGIYFEDPSLQAVRGYLSFEELDARWRDTGPYGKHYDHYGVAIWKPGWRGPSVYYTRAEHIY